HVLCTFPLIGLISWSLPLSAGKRPQGLNLGLAMGDSSPVDVKRPQGLNLGLAEEPAPMLGLGLGLGLGSGSFDEEEEYPATPVGLKRQSSRVVSADGAKVEVFNNLFLNRQLSLHTEEVLGKGAFGMAKLMNITPRGETVVSSDPTMGVLKTYLDVESSPTQAEKEYRYMKELSGHDAFLKPYSILFDNGVYSVMMEQGGKSLKSIRGTAEAAELVPRAKLMLKFVRGFKHMHEKGIFHADIKPDNLLIASGGDVVKVIDFGEAGYFGDTGTAQRGTVFYRAPEQTQGEEMTDKSDIFALGVSFYLLKQGDYPQQVFGANIRGSEDYAFYMPEEYAADFYASKSVLLDATADVLDHLIVDGMLHPDPQQRLSAADLELKLQSILAAAVQ
ncbi:MAG: protein kinase, partial [Zetaproteobacteria bacterium]|nr:protein kinase [Zetaproteobacteria bacterium]